LLDHAQQLSGSVCPEEANSTGFPCGVWRYASAQASFRAKSSAELDNPLAVTKRSSVRLGRGNARQAIPNRNQALRWPTSSQLRQFLRTAKRLRAGRDYGREDQH